MVIGGYEIKVSAGSLPEKVATGFNKVFENMLGATYEPIAYLGSKVVNGTNHAIMAEQTLVTGKDVKSIVLVVLNEKPGDVDGSNFSIVEISTLISNGGQMGGMNIDPQIKIPADAMEVFEKQFAGFVGAQVKPFALLATQVVRGAAYVFAVESTMIVSPSFMKANQPKSVNLVKLYSDFSEIETIEVIRGTKPAELLQAAGNLATPLGEWP